MRAGAKIAEFLRDSPISFLERALFSAGAGMSMSATPIAAELSAHMMRKAFPAIPMHQVVQQDRSEQPNDHRREDNLPEAISNQQFSEPSVESL